MWYRQAICMQSSHNRGFATQGACLFRAKHTERVSGRAGLNTPE
jgi:hypothetical protein